MQCSSCNTINESGAKFCRECGQKLEVSNPTPRLSAPAEHVKVGELIYASYKYKESGKLDDAALACQGALALNERNASAHALLGSVYELKGDIPSAIKEYETVLSITPDSVTDRQILERLKSLQAVNASLKGAGIPRMPGVSGWKSLARPYIPFAAAFAGFFLVLSLGLFSLHHTGGKAASQGVGAPVPVPVQADAAEPGLTPPAAAVPAQGAVPPAASIPGAGAQPAQPAAASAVQNTPVPMPAAAAVRSRGVPPVPVPKLPRSILPLTGKTRTADVRPAIVPVLPKVLHKDEDDTPVITPVDEPVHKTAHPSGAGVITPVITPDEPREKQPAVSPVITPVITPAPSRSSRWVPRGSPEQQAMQYQKAGQYREAISSWRQAMGNGADSGRVQQQIGLCYQKLGQHGEAVESYKKAISVYKQQQAEGRDQNDVQRNIRSCEAAIRVSSP